ncbi:hypothetical protein O3Q52_19760, partial [Streptomyces sp. ActVer]|uniref:hypothetical protein n=1 Tax=Streptomyces sp. ActVer TaxID=3014558 RepID=UPI0022B30B19
MEETAVDDWSPAANPYAIAVSEAQWARRDAALCVRRIHAGNEVVGGFDSRQIDARHLCIALRQLLTAETLEQAALADLGMDPMVGQTLEQARKRFELSLPDITQIRNGLIHFENWSRGLGHGPQSQRVKAGDEPRDVARAFWGFGYDVTTDTVSMGPYRINVTAAEEAAAELAHAIYMAARAVDMKNTTDHRDAAAQVLTDAEVLAHRRGRSKSLQGSTNVCGSPSTPRPSLRRPNAAPCLGGHSPHSLARGSASRRSGNFRLTIQLSNSLLGRRSASNHAPHGRRSLRRRKAEGRQCCCGVLGLMESQTQLVSVHLDHTTRRNQCHTRNCSPPRRSSPTR